MLAHGMSDVDASGIDSLALAGGRARKLSAHAEGELPEFVLFASLLRCN